MSKAFIYNNQVTAIEDRENIEAYYHPEALSNFVDIPEGLMVSVGDFYINKEFIKSSLPDSIPSEREEIEKLKKDNEMMQELIADLASLLLEV